jgi:hypothetical protein
MAPPNLGGARARPVDQPATERTAASDSEHSPGGIHPAPQPTFPGLPPCAGAPGTPTRPVLPAGSATTRVRRFPIILATLHRTNAFPLHSLHQSRLATQLPRRVSTGKNRLPSSLSADPSPVLVVENRNPDLTALSPWAPRNPWKRGLFQHRPGTTGLLPE